MKKRWMALALILAVCLAQTAAAEMQVYAGGISEEGIRQLTATLSAAFPQETWICVGGGESLRELVLSDRAPQLAVCAPQEARAWAAQGLLAAMDGVSGEIGRMQRQVVEACVYDESLFMLPLSARHRQMAVNVHLMEARSMGYLLDSLSCPVWYPSQFYQVLEEFMLAGETAVEIWPVSQEGEAVRTLVQALYGGFLTDGGALLPDEQALLEGMEWVGALTEAGMIGYADSRQAALERFAAGETAIFLDWSQREEALCAQLQEEMEYVLLPYPSSTGLPVRSWELTGVCVFGGEEEKTRLAMEAAAYLGGRAHTSGGALWADDALWLSRPEGAQAGATLSRLFDEALDAVIGHGADAWEQMRRMRAAIRMLP